MVPYVNTHQYGVEAKCSYASQTADHTIPGHHLLLVPSAALIPTNSTIPTKTATQHRVAMLCRRPTTLHLDMTRFSYHPLHQHELMAHTDLRRMPAQCSHAIPASSRFTGTLTVEYDISKPVPSTQQKRGILLRTLLRRCFKTPASQTRLELLHPALTALPPCAWF